MQETVYDNILNCSVSQHVGCCMRETVIFN